MSLVETYMNLSPLQLDDLRDHIRTRFAANGLCDDIIVTLYEPSWNDGDSIHTSILYFHVKIGDELIFVGEGEYCEDDPSKFSCGHVVDVSEPVRKFIQFLYNNVAASSLLCDLLYEFDRKVSVSILNEDEIETPYESW